MKQRVKQPNRLQFLGWDADGPEVVLRVRMMVSVGGGRETAHGPILSIYVPAEHLLQEDICNAAAWAQQRLEIARQVGEIDLDAPLPGL